MHGGVGASRAASAGDGGAAAAGAGGRRARLFHGYLAAHSLLAGLLPFFVPVYLWRVGLGLADLCLLVGVSGFAFAAALAPWQRLACGRPLATLIRLSFVAELVLACAVTASALALSSARGASGALPDTLAAGTSVALLVGTVNGVYNAFFWTTQRALFSALGDGGDTGRRYGTLQIVVAVFLKAGILAGGALLEAGGILWIVALSALVGLVAGEWLAREAGGAPLHRMPPRRWRASLGFRDRSGSAGVFAIDGPFLYLESHFWTLSLFLLVREDHARLGIVVVALAIGFSLLFLAIRSRIDRSAVDTVYRTGVVLYALSWLARPLAGDGGVGGATLALLLAVTFCASLFRLAFNKRFFDLARHADEATGGAIGYLVIKSHVSQLAIGVVFVPLAVTLHLSAPDPAAALTALYLAAAPLSLLYLRYRQPPLSAPPERAV